MRTQGRLAVLAAGLLGAWLHARPGLAEFRFKKDSFTKISTVVAQSITGVGFRPKAVIFFWTRQTAADTFNPEIQVGYGFATGPANERAIAIASQDGSFGGNTGKGQWQSSSVVLFSAAAPTIGAQAELTSLDPDGFTLNWTVNEARADIIHYVALGGSDITNARVDHFVKATGTGNLPITGVGFKPDFVMFLAAHTTSLDVGTTEAQVAMGFASGPTERGTVGVQLEDGDGFARGTCNWQRADRVLLELSDTCAADTEFDFVSFDLDGFTVNRIVNNNDTRLVHYLALQGGEYKVGSFNKSTASPAPVDQTVTGVGFPPVGLLLASKNRVTNAADETDARLSFGAGDGTTEGATWWHDLHAITADNAERTSTSKIAVHATEPVTLDAEADLKSLDADGFTLTWTANNNLAAHEILYVAMGSSTRYRSIGTAPDYLSGTVTATTGSRIVTGSGTGWRAANRGRGDRIQIDGVDYTAYSVDSDTQLTLTEAFRGTTGSGKAYNISRQFATLQAWEDCIDGLANGGFCTYFPVASDSLVADNRIEVGIAYNDGSAFTGPLTIDGRVDNTNTDATHTITLTVDAGNRHTGRASTGVVLDNGASGTEALSVLDNFVTVEWMEIKGGSTQADGIIVNGVNPANKVVIRNNIIHDVSGDAIELRDLDVIGDVYNNVIYGAGRQGIRLTPDPWGAGSQIRILNNTLYGNGVSVGVAGIGAVSASNLNVLLRNNICHSSSAANFNVPSIDPASSNNLASDATGATHSPAGGGQDNVPLASMNFVSTTLGAENLHITTGSAAENAAVDLSSVFTFDIDAGARATPWDIGADDILATTAVDLVSFEARGLDGAVELTWETASELDNLGFHLYRALTADGSYERLTPSAIPGLGSSPVGAGYRYTDSGLVNGQTYFYQLEDIETTGNTKRHGPVSATARTSGSAVDDSAPAPDGPPLSSVSYGDPSAVSLRVVERNSRGLVLELITGGFLAEPRDGSFVRLSVSGFAEEWQSGSPALPTKRAWVDVEAGRGVRLGSVWAEGVLVFPSLRPSPADSLEAVASLRGTVRAGQRTAREGAAFRGTGMYPENWARLLSVGYQAETKKALVELSPLRWSRDGGDLLLARRLRVRLLFTGRERERHRESESHQRRTLLRRLVTRENGIYALSFDEVMPSSRSSLRASSLRLSRQGQPVAFHLEPSTGPFGLVGRGSTLYFVSEGGSLNPYGNEAVYELELAPGGVRMPVHSVLPEGPAAAFYWQRVEREENRYYQAGLLEAEDLWLWDVLLAPVTKSYSFTVSRLRATVEPARLELWLQGASDLPGPDHHLRVSVNGTVVAESELEGKKPLTLVAELGAGLLQAGENELSIENVGDTGAAYSMVLLDRFAVDYPRELEAEGGSLEGRFGSTEVAEVGGLGSGALVVDVTEKADRWIEAQEDASGRLRFAVEAGRRYLAVSPEAVLKPEVRRARPLRLKSERNRADYLVVGPQDLLEGVGPLVELRRRQGLSSRAVSVEQVYSEFGFGESSPEAVRQFLSYAHHHWRKPAPRYVLLLGDGSYDFKNYLGTGVKNQMPPYLVKTTYLWTASDPAYAAVKGEDILPDFAIGRLPAANAQEVRAMVEKILAHETSGTAAGGPVVLVADNPDTAGDFEANAEEIAAGLLASRNPQRIYLGRLGVERTRSAIVEAFEQGASLLSYVGHGGIHLWAQEDILSNARVAALAPNAERPLLLTLNCLNGYFHFPYFNSLSEELVKADGKGAVAAFSPSGLSVDEPAHGFHKTLLAELLSGNHARLGDVILAAESAYASSGAFPELLRIYHLLGDPALMLR